jgi:hypothetical protein
MPRDPVEMTPAALRLQWLTALRVCLAASALAHPVWEVLQLPLYALWRTGTDQEIAFAVLHCSAGDVVISALTLLASLVVVGSSAWPAARFGRVAAATMLLGIAYTIWSEYFNTSIRGAWSYSELMPVLPPFGTGMSPLAQWVVVPAIAFGLTRRMLRRRMDVEMRGKPC